MQQVCYGYKWHFTYHNRIVGVRRLPRYSLCERQEFELEVLESVDDIFK